MRGTRASESHERAIRKLSELVDAAALSPDHWNEVCAGFQEYFPDGRILMQGYDAAAPYAMPFAGAGWEDINLDVYFAHYAAINPWNAAWADLPVLRSILSDEALPRSILEQTEFYNDWLKPMGGADSASGIKIVQDRSRMATLCVHYDGRSAEGNHEALAPVFQALAPKMRRALDCNRAVLRNQRLIKTGNLMHDLLDPAIIVDRDCRLLGANAAAEELFASRRAVGVRAGDKLSFEDARLHASFARIVDAVCLRLPGSTGCHELQMQAQGEGLSISILPLAQNLREYALRGPVGYFAPTSMALVIFRATQTGNRDLIAALRSRFGLTEQEGRIALALRGGGTIAEVATEVGMTYETARAHLKSAFAKTRTHRQRELLALVLEEVNRPTV